MGIQNSRDLIEFEHEVWITGKPKYIDVLYLEKEILIEQKSKGVSLNQRYHQSDGQMLSPYEQTRCYTLVSYHTVILYSNIVNVIVMSKMVI